MVETSEPIESDDPIDLAAMIGPVQLHSSHARRAALVIKTGRLALSPAAIAWFSSISIHTIVIALGIWIAVTLVHHARLPADWGGGGGSSGGLVAAEPQSQIMRQLLPGIAPVPAETPHDPVDDTATDVRIDENQKVAFNFDSFSSSDAASIGLPQSSANVTPHFGSHRPQLGPTSDESNSSSDDDSGPGLPGSVLGKGLPTPDYPAESKRLGEQGTVRVGIEVLPDGKIGDIRVLSDPGFSRLRDSSLSAAEKLRGYPFTPARHDGKPVREVLVIPYVFRLK
jgi:TonB family protein